MLCDYFGIPVYYKPEKKGYLEYKILKLLVEVSPKELYTSEIANATDMKHEQVCDTLKNDRYSVSHFLSNRARRLFLDTKPVK